MPISSRIIEVQSRIAAACRRAGRPRDSVRLIAVSKTVGVDLIREAIAAGLTEFGENRVQEAAAKIPAVQQPQQPQPPRPLTWHLIGHLQSNKAAKAVELFDLIHSIDSEDLAREVARRAGQRHKRQRVLIQVNCSGEMSKSGCAPDELAALARTATGLPELELTGLMTIGPLDPDPESARPAFRLLKQLRDATGQQLGRALPDLSMGMTGDFEIAIEEGATLVRVGTAIFGERPRPAV